MGHFGTNSTCETEIIKNKDKYRRCHHFIWRFRVFCFFSPSLLFLFFISSFPVLLLFFPFHHFNHVYKLTLSSRLVRLFCPFLFPLPPMICALPRFSDFRGLFIWIFIGFLWEDARRWAPEGSPYAKFLVAHVILEGQYVTWGTEEAIVSVQVVTFCWCVFLALLQEWQIWIAGYKSIFSNRQFVEK